MDRGQELAEMLKDILMEANRMDVAIQKIMNDARIEVCQEQKEAETCQTSRKPQS